MQEAQAFVQVVLPQLGVPLEEKLTAPDVVDEDVQPAGVALDPLDQPGNLGWFQVVDGDGGGRAPGLPHQVGGLLNGFGPPVLRLVLAGGAARDVDVSPGGAELDGDSPPRAPPATSATLPARAVMLASAIYNRSFVYIMLAVPCHASAPSPTTRCSTPRC